MLAIRMQRTGRKGHAMFRVVVQESRLTPTSGRVVATLGSYDPHAKVATLAKDKAAYYLEHGAQPSDRAARLLQKEGVKLPSWVKLTDDKERKLRNPEKLRKNQPKEAAVPVEAEKPAETEAPAEAPAAEATEEEKAEA
jgi:small subunit ribosomal protein S16